jgi:hypothetical protein
MAYLGNLVVGTTNGMLLSAKFCDWRTTIWLSGGPNTNVNVKIRAGLELSRHLDLFFDLELTILYLETSR